MRGTIARLLPHAPRPGLEPAALGRQSNPRPFGVQAGARPLRHTSRASHSVSDSKISKLRQRADVTRGRDERSFKGDNSPVSRSLRVSPGSTDPRGGGSERLRPRVRGLGCFPGRFQRLGFRTEPSLFRLGLSFSCRSPGCRPSLPLGSGRPGSAQGEQNLRPCCLGPSQAAGRPAAPRAQLVRCPERGCLRSEAH